MITKNRIIQYMRIHVEDHTDPLTGEVNDTTLAEDAFQALEPSNDSDIPEEYFECAFRVGTRHEISSGVIPTLERWRSYKLLRDEKEN
jgi:hypothetical protein